MYSIRRREIGTEFRLEKNRGSNREYLRFAGQGAAWLCGFAENGDIIERAKEWKRDEAPPLSTLSAPIAYRTAKSTGASRCGTSSQDVNPAAPSGGVFGALENGHWKLGKYRKSKGRFELRIVGNRASSRISKLAARQSLTKNARSIEELDRAVKCSAISRFFRRSLLIIRPALKFARHHRFFTFPFFPRCRSGDRDRPRFN